jgi:hypothetical protein
MPMSGCLSAHGALVDRSKILRRRADGLALMVYPRQISAASTPATCCQRSRVVALWSRGPAQPQPIYHTPEDTIADNVSLERLQVSMELIGAAAYRLTTQR